MKVGRFIITKSQIMHALTAFVLTPLAGFVSAWVANHFPGLPHFSKGEILGVFITGASGALGLALHYLHGWQLWERTIGQLVDVQVTTKKPTK